MTREEAIEMLRKAPKGDKPSRINSVFTQAQAVELVLGWVRGLKEGEVLPEIFEKRVWQVSKNQRRPKVRLV